MQELAIFLKKNLQINMLVPNYCQYTGEYRRAAHSICNLKYSIPKESPIVFRNGSKYDYRFIV